MHVIAAKAVALKEAMQPEFKAYQQQILKNSRKMAQAFLDRGVKIVSGGTDNHLFLVDLIDKKVTGKDVDAALDRAHITVNKNAVPNDPQPPFVTSGIRVGTPSVTTRGFREGECAEVTGWMCDIIDNMGDEKVVQRVRKSVEELCRRFPMYGS
jgi:glycine hydroxymethyltransferase